MLIQITKDKTSRSKTVLLRDVKFYFIRHEKNDQQLF